MKRFLKLAALGGLLYYFFDRESGAQRRAKVRDSVVGMVGRHRRHGQQTTEVVKDFDDQTLKAKVESEVFRPADAPKGDVNVNVENGIVFLRGEVEGDLVEDLEKRVAQVNGVRGVENLLSAKS